MRRSSNLRAAVAVLLALYGTAAFAGAPVGNIASLDGATKEFLINSLKMENALNPQVGANDLEEIANAVMNYFYNHQSEISNQGKESENVDIVVCLLDRHGHSAGPIMNGQMQQFCQKHLK